MSGKLVLIDMDGTLFDTSEGVKMSYKAGLAHFHIFVEDDSELDRVIGPSLYDSYHEFYGLNDKEITEAVEKYREVYNEEGIYKLRMYDGMEEMLRDLRQDGNMIGLATTKPLVMASKILAFTGLRKYFDVLCGSNLDGSMSDKCEIIRNCMEQAGITEQDRVYMVGDRLYDIAGAKKAGVHSIGVTFGFGSREELQEAGAEYIADAAKEVALVIKNQ